MNGFTINSVDVFEDLAELITLNNAANYDLICLDGLIITYCVTAENNSEVRSFQVQLQSAERNNGMMAYNGYEMVFDGDCDESDFLLEFMEYDETFNDYLMQDAKQKSKSILEILQD